ncbi:MAG: hypothetical protein Q4C54_00025 [Clostridia bacterium]|nr:hypothetical protein [Clostridia bacterium]
MVQYCVSNPVGAEVVAGMQRRYAVPVLICFYLAAMLPEKLRIGMKMFSTPAKWVVPMLMLALNYWLSFNMLMGWRFLPD